MRHLALVSLMLAGCPIASEPLDAGVEGEGEGEGDCESLDVFPPSTASFVVDTNPPPHLTRSNAVTCPDGFEAFALAANVLGSFEWSSDCHDGVFSCTGDDQLHWASVDFGGSNPCLSGVVSANKGTFDDPSPPGPATVICLLCLTAPPSDMAVQISDDVGDAAPACVDLSSL